MDGPDNRLQRSWRQIHEVQKEVPPCAVTCHTHSPATQPIILQAVPSNTIIKKHGNKLQTVTDLQPEVGAEQWPSYEESGLAEWEGFLGLAESAQP